MHRRLPHGGTDPLAWLERAKVPMRRYHASGRLTDLWASIDLLKRARACAEPAHPQLTMIAGALAAQLSLLRAATHAPDVCRAAAEASRFVLDRTTPDVATRSLMLANLGLATLGLAAADHDPAQAEAAVAAFREGWRLGHDANHAINFAAAAVEVLRMTGDATPAREAVELLVDRGDARAADTLTNLLGALLTNPDGHDELGEVCRRWLSPGGAPTDVPLLRTLCGIALMSAPHGGVEQLLETAALGRTLLAAAGDDDEVVAEAAHNTANALRTLAQRTHDADIAREAIDLGRTAVLRASRAERVDVRLVRANLAAAHNVLYEITGDLEAQRDALHESRLAMAHTPADVPDSVTATHAVILHRYAARRQDVDLLREAVSAARVACSQPDLPREDRVGRLSGLVAMLSDLHALSGDEAAIREAAELGEQGLALVSPGDYAEPFVLLDLARAYRLLGSAERDTGRMRAAVELAERLTEAPVSIASAAALERALALHELGTSTAADLEALTASAATRPDVRFQAALLRVQAAERDGAPLLDLLTEAVELLRLNVSSGPLWADRENALRTYAGLTGVIVSSGVAEDRLELAVELLERSRGLLSRDTLDIRGDLATLHASDPALAEELREIDTRLRAVDARDRTSAAVGVPDRESERTLAAERASLVQRWKAVQRAAAAGPSDLATLAAEGPIVLVAAAQGSGYALLITNDRSRPVRALPLPGLDITTATERVLTFHTARHFATDDSYSLRVRRLAQAEVRDTLAWVGQTAAEPILAELGFTRTPSGNDWPRLWWCPTGLLSYLPWHAAGSVPDRVVSSYTASLRVLEHVRRTSQGVSPGRTLIVAQSETPAASALRGVPDEVSGILELLPEATVLQGAKATKAAFLAALRDHEHVHLACHALTDVHAPSTSRLLLADHESEPLTVSDLAALNLPDRGLAVLSACSTSEISPNLSDEAVHLTAAFQLAGFRDVIGALWPVSDATAAEISRDLYAHLTDGPALALHRAVRRQRERYPATPTIWASYMHTGA
ncbi:CHAT domain-containing protein [Nonomuraea sp. NPDC003214]